MSFNSQPGFRRSLRAVSVIAAVVVALTLVGTAAGAGAATAGRIASSAPCLATARGAAWSYKGQKGTAYTVIGENGASCSLGGKWLKRITASHGSKSPKGWACLAISSGIGECQ